MFNRTYNLQEGILNCKDIHESILALKSVKPMDDGNRADKKETDTKMSNVLCTKRQIHFCTEVSETNGCWETSDVLRFSFVVQV